MFKPQLNAMYSVLYYRDRSSPSVVVIVVETRRGNIAKIFERVHSVRQATQPNHGLRAMIEKPDGDQQSSHLQAVFVVHSSR